MKNHDDPPPEGRWHIKREDLKKTSYAVFDSKRSMVSIAGEQRLQLQGRVAESPDLPDHEGTWHIKENT